MSEPQRIIERHVAARIHRVIVPWACAFRAAPWLKGELPGILNWALRGCAAWQEQGLNPPKVVTDATREYREELDVLAEFLAECCELNKLAETRASDLYRAYKSWRETAGERAESQKIFGQGLTEKGFERHLSGGVWYRGVCLRAGR